MEYISVFTKPTHTHIHAHVESIQSVEMMEEHVRRKKESGVKQTQNSSELMKQGAWEDSSWWKQELE